MTTTENENSNREKTADLEAVLFAASNLVAFTQLADVLSLSKAEVKVLCLNLSLDYEKRGSGIRLQVFDDKVQLISAPESASAVETFLGIESTQKLSRPSLEALTIVAYKQPITRPGIDAIRGVNSDGVVRNLVNRGLIEETGRAETPGRPIQYSTTQDFLLYFGLSSLEALSPYEQKEIAEQTIENERLLKQ